MKIQISYKMQKDIILTSQYILIVISMYLLGLFFSSYFEVNTTLMIDERLPIWLNNFAFTFVIGFISFVILTLVFSVILKIIDYFKCNIEIIN